MVPFIYRCPITGRNVQGFFADEVPPKETETYESVTCVTCTRVHLVNRSTGRTLGAENDAAGLRRPDYEPISRNENVAGLPRPFEQRLQNKVTGR